MLAPPLMEKLEKRLRELAASELAGADPNRKLREVQAALATVTGELERVQRNLALAETPQQYQAVSAVFDQLVTRQEHLRTVTASTTTNADRLDNLQGEIDAALVLLQHLPDRVAGSASLAAAGDVFRAVNARLFLMFKCVTLKKRTVNKVAGGVLTFGAARRQWRFMWGLQLGAGLRAPRSTTIPYSSAGRKVLPAQSVLTPVGEGNSLGNVNRGDRI